MCAIVLQIAEAVQLTALMSTSSHGIILIDVRYEIVIFFPENGMTICRSIIEKPAANKSLYAKFFVDGKTF